MSSDPPDRGGRPDLRSALAALRLLLFLVLAGGCAPSPAAAQGLKKATLMPQWYPQAQFAGYYVALDKGIYRRHGIDLSIIPGGAGRDPAHSLREGRTDFAVLWLASALRQRSSGVKIVNLAQIVQRSSMLLIARKSSGIARPEELQGKKVGVWEGDLGLPGKAFLARYRLKVREIPQSQTVNLFLRGGIDVASAMWYNEYHTIVSSGVDPDELNIFRVSEHGITLPEDGLYTLEQSHRRDPALSAALVRASLEGWRYAFDHPEEALDIVLRHMQEARIPANRSHQRWMLQSMRGVVAPREQGELGRLRPADYQAAAAQLRALGAIREIPPFQEFVGGAHEPR